MDGVTINASEIQKAVKAINNLKEIADPKKARAVQRKALKPVKDQAVRNAPKGKTGNLKESIGFYNEKVNIPGTKPTGVLLGPRTTRKYKGYHGSLVEFGGNSTRKPKTTFGVLVFFSGNSLVAVKEVKKMPKRPYMFPAWNSKKGEVAKITLKEYEKITLQKFKV